MATIVYLDAEDEITTAATRIRQAAETRVAHRRPVRLAGRHVAHQLPAAGPRGDGQRHGAWRSSRRMRPRGPSPPRPGSPSSRSVGEYESALDAPDEPDGRRTRRRRPRPRARSRGRGDAPRTRPARPAAPERDGHDGHGAAVRPDVIGRARRLAGSAAVRRSPGGDDRSAGRRDPRGGAGRDRPPQPRGPGRDAATAGPGRGLVGGLLVRRWSPWSWPGSPATCSCPRPRSPSRRGSWPSGPSSSPSAPTPRSPPWTRPPASSRPGP